MMMMQGLVAEREDGGGGGGDGVVEGWGTPSLMLHPIEPTSNLKGILMLEASRLVK